MSTEPKRTSFRNQIARLVGLLALLLAFLAALVTPGLPKIYAKSPPPLIASALLDHTVPAGEYLSAGFLLRNFPCVDQDNNNDCDYRDKFTSVIYRFDILSRSGETSPDICEGQGLNRDRTFAPAFYNSSRTLSPIPLRLKRECPTGPYTLQLTVTYAESDSNEKVTLTDKVDFDVGDPQLPTATPTATATQTPDPQLPTLTPTATATATQPSKPKQPIATATATATQAPSRKQPIATATATATATQAPSRKQPIATATATATQALSRKRPPATPTATATATHAPSRKQPPATATATATATHAPSRKQPPATATATATATQPSSPLQPAGLPSPTPTKTPGEPQVNRPASLRPTPTPTSPWASPCIVPHQATPVQVCRNKIGVLHFIYVGNNMVFSGPIFDSISAMASDYPFGHVPPAVELYRGINSGTGKEVVVDYLTYNRLLRVSTFYADNEYDLNKPYIFTIDEEGNVKHLAW